MPRPLKSPASTIVDHPPPDPPLVTNKRIWNMEPVAKTLICNMGPVHVFGEWGLLLRVSLFGT